MTKLFALLTLLLCAVIAHGDFRGQIGAFVPGISGTVRRALRELKVEELLMTDADRAIAFVGKQ